MAKIIGIGNALVDVLVTLTDASLLEDLHLGRGGMWHIDASQLSDLQMQISSLSVVRATGGSASNTIHALSLMGANVGLFGTVADDDAGRFFATMLRRRGIEDNLTVVKGGKTGIATTFILPDGERTFATYLGVAPQIALETLHFERYAAGDILHIEGYLVQNHDIVETVLSRAKAAGLLVSFDLASWNIVSKDLDFVRHLVTDYADIVFANEDEATAFAGTHDARAALHHLASLTHIAVVKVGKEGAWAQRDDEETFAPAVQCTHVVDTTAAGDFFAAGFLHGVIHGSDLRKCVERGNVVASQVIQVLGTQVTQLTY